MYLKSVLVRFYKSFNFDYLRKYDSKVQTQHEWEKLNDLWYPYVRIPIDQKITTVVGANESGKTHLLTAIEKGLSGKGIEREDFCRYSKFFAVQQGTMRWPDYGFEWAGLADKERTSVAKACGMSSPLASDRFFLFRNDRTQLTVYLPGDGSHEGHSVADAEVLTAVLPTVFRLQENVGLPEAVPIRFLAGDVHSGNGLEALSREHRVGLFETILGNTPWFHTKEAVVQSADSIAREVSKYSKPEPGALTSANTARSAELRLAHDLIRKVAKIDPEALQELYRALRQGRDAFANSIIDEINEALEARLNFPHWWVQDRSFRLLVSPREYDLAFTIKDRTETEYAFTERSSGLRYFLSYYIQYLAHERPLDRAEILLMDEPDAFLSNQGQQDLIKIFHAFAEPEPAHAPTQVVYVTHSPFLIDKNHGERIRVLEKGIGDEGTRVVRDASRNHYEPLRSAFGSFVGETVFIGHCNLVVEGLSDQIVLAGAAMHLRQEGASDLETLDLNHLTIVPSGGASHVPYLVYLARGRDIEKPAVIVLLDSDQQGDEARRALLKGGPNRKELIGKHCILQIGDLAATPGIAPALGHALLETEDLIPLEICALAAQRYLRNVVGAAEDTVRRLTADNLRTAAGDTSIFKTIQSSLTAIDGDLHVEKVGFARAIVETIAELNAREDDSHSKAVLSTFSQNMRLVFRRLRRMQRDAERALTAERVSARVNRAKSSFLQDHPTSARREHAFVLFEEIQAALDSSAEADAILLELQSLRRDFKIDEDPKETVEGFQEFRDRLDRIQYAGRLATQVPTLQEAASRATSSVVRPGAPAGGAVDSV